MRTFSHAQLGDDRYLVIDDTDEDASEIVTVITDGYSRSSRRFDSFRAYGRGGAE